MKVAAVLCLVAIASVSAQTTEKPGFFKQIGNVFKETASALGGQLKDYVHSQGDNILQNVLPSVTGQLLSSSFWNLVKTIGQTHSTSSTTKRDLSVLQNLASQFQSEVSNAKDLASQLGEGVEHLISNFFQGKIDAQQYLNNLPNLENAANQIVSDLSGNLKNILGQYTSKRDLGLLQNVFDLPAFHSALQNMEIDAKQVFSQLVQNLSNVVDPQQFLAMASQIASQQN